jgi:hypothetical protein
MPKNIEKKLKGQALSCSVNVEEVLPFFVDVYCSSAQNTVRIPVGDQLSDMLGILCFCYIEFGRGFEKFIE